MGRASAPGKVIITGEHSVVYGYPALAGALDLRCKARIENSDPGLVIHADDLDKTLEYSSQELQTVQAGGQCHEGFDNLAGAVLSMLQLEQISHEITITSEVPIGAGLGSSAATAVSIVGSIFDHMELPLDPKSISEHAYQAEKIAHGTPSGIDNTVSSLGGLVWYQDGETTKLPTSSSIPLIIANTNVPRDTKSLVNQVRSRKSRNDEIMTNILDQIGLTTKQIEESLVKSRYKKAGELFDINHGLLDAIGVSHPSLSQLVHKARQHGAFGAKLTGAGGGGCIIVLVDENTSAEVHYALDADGIDVYQTNLSATGVTLGD